MALPEIQLTGHTSTIACASALIGIYGHCLHNVRCLRASPNIPSGAKLSNNKRRDFTIGNLTHRCTNTSTHTHKHAQTHTHTHTARSADRPHLRPPPPPLLKGSMGPDASAPPPALAVTWLLALLLVQVRGGEDGTSGAPAGSCLP